jgi:hypothetical protein
MWDFEKNTTVDDINTVPEQFRGLYVEKDGKFLLADFAKGLTDAYAGQTKALDKARKDLKAANDESAARRVTKAAVLELAKGLGIEGIDEENPLASLDAHVKALMEKGKGGSEIKVSMDKIKAESERRITELTAAKDNEVKAMRGTLEKYLVKQAATAALAKAGGNVDLLLDKIERVAKVVKDGDDYVVRIVDDSGEVRSDGAGGYLDVAGYVADMKTKPAYLICFKAEAAAGSGHNPNSQKQQFRPGQQQGAKSSVDKIAAGLSKGGLEHGRVAADSGPGE